jgi:aspartate carbamoyltransferase catalytic subunit
MEKDFITLGDINRDDILTILNTAETMKYVMSQKVKRAPHLQGKTVILLFYEKNSRALLSYQLAAQYLSANVADMSEGSSAAHTLVELGRIIDQMGGDIIVIRTPLSGGAKLLAENVNARVINAGDGLNENPSQSLIDLMTIKAQKGSFEGLKVTFVGDIAHSRVTRSNIWALMKLGAEVTLAGPPTLVPDEWATYGLRILYDACEAVEDADVIMALRMGPPHVYASLLPSLNEYKSFFKIDERMLSYAKKDAIVLHPGPISRGIEISSQVIGTPSCMVNDQMANGVAVRMALLYLLS